MNNPNARGLKKPEWANLSEDTDWAFFGESLEDEPKTLAEAKERGDWPEWKKAMDEEMEQLRNLGTYIKVELPEDRIPIACKWVYRLKQDSTGKIICYKAQLVAKGFSQIPGIDSPANFTAYAGPVSGLLPLVDPHTTNFAAAVIGVELSPETPSLEWPGGYKTPTPFIPICWPWCVF
jgi:hypothetical protein